jgi:hypothetical protein
MLCAKTWPSWKGGSARDGVNELFTSLDISKQEYAFGITKIFIRNPQTVRDGFYPCHLLTFLTFVQTTHHLLVVSGNFRYFALPAL